MKNLHLYKFDNYSQNGEDGIIKEILNRSFSDKKINTVEFGAGDIEKNSNTFNLIKDDKVNNAVFVEIDLVLHKKLIELKNTFSSIVPINQKVEIEKNHQNSIDNILKENDIENNIDIMSIDIDSYDLDVYRSIEIYFPKLLIIEGGRQKYGVFSEHSMNGESNSFSSIYQEVTKKFELIGYNGNLFFLNKNYFSKEHIIKNYIIDDEYHYLLHCIYVNYKKRGFLKKKLMNLISKNKQFLKLLINYK